jgi:hypothetical protein
MGLTATLSETSLAAEPGDEISLQVTVRNTGSVVDEFTLDVVGPAADWAVAEPPTLSLFPDDDGVAVIRFQVPRTIGVRSGEIPFAVRVRSREDPEGTIAEEGVLVVGGFTDVSAELVPQSSRGSRMGRHQVTFDNRGNTEVTAVLKAADPENALRFKFNPPELISEPGTATFARLFVRPRKLILRGQAKTHTFEVLLDIDGQEPIVLPGSMVQRPIFGSFIMMALLGLLALLLILFIMWQTLLRPKVESTAKEAVAKPLSQTNAAVNDIGERVGTNPTLPVSEEAIADSAGAGGGGGGPQAGGGGGGGGTTATSEPAVPRGSGSAQIATEFGNPTDRRLLVTGTGTITDGFRIDAKKVFSLTDLVFQNPAGDAGTVALMRGRETLFLDSLANFRSMDYHFVAPVVFDENTDVTLRVECANTGGKACSVAAYMVGFVKNKP